MPAKTDPFQSDTLAKAQAKADPWPNDGYEKALKTHGDLDEGWRRCIFRHDVLASHGFETLAGFVCYGHSAEFDTAGS